MQVGDIGKFRCPDCHKMHLPPACSVHKVRTQLPVEYKLDSLRFTPGEQNVLAELCSLCRQIQYGILCESDIPPYADIGEDLVNILDRFHAISPQNFDDLYDRFHRSGVNA